MEPVYLHRTRGHGGLEERALDSVWQTRQPQETLTPAALRWIRAFIPRWIVIRISYPSQTSHPLRIMDEHHAVHERDSHIEERRVASWVVLS